MTISLEGVVVVIGIFINVITVVRIFTVLESRLTRLETTLSLLMQSLNGIKFIDRRDGEKV